MNLQELLVHCLWFLMAVIFAGNVRADNHVPVVDASQNAFLNEEAAKQEYVGSLPHVPTQTTSTAQPRAKTPNQELLVKIESLQDEMQKLRGRIEVQNHDLQVMRTQQQALYRDLDSRLAKAENTKPTQVASNTQAQTKQITEAPASDNGDAFYQAAYQMLQNKQYPRAISAFQVYLKNYPDSHYAANAHYWLGELYLSQGFIDKAKQEFNIVIDKYAKSGKVPAALLKLGFAHYDNGEWQKARATLNKVRQTYPDTDTARMAAARITDMDQQGL